MKILLVGASGFVGRNLHAVLSNLDHDVTPLSRRHGADMAEMLSPKLWAPWVRGMEAVINAVGIIGESGPQRFSSLHRDAPIALFDACVEARVSRVVQISSSGADDAAFSAYHLTKKAADDHLRATPLPWFVLRPSVIYGRDGASTEVFQRLSRLPVIPVIGDGRQVLQPVHVADVVATVAACLTATQARQTLDVVGNEDIAYVEWLQRLRLAQGLTRGRVLHLPVWMVLAGTTVLAPFHPMLRPENIRMLLTGTHGNPSSWHQLIGRKALDFSPELLTKDAVNALREKAPQTWTT